MFDNRNIIFHVDVNSAFLSFEAVYRLQHGALVDLRDIPSAVAGAQATRHGIILAKSIPTKKYGVKTGEAIWEAKRKCPGLVIIPPNYFLYMQCHNALMELLRRYTDKVQVFSIDECFMQIWGMETLDDVLAKANQIRKHVKQELGFTVSIGVSTNKLLAKMGSELKKPNAVSTLFPSEMQEKMWILPVEDLFGVGQATAPKLHCLGINTIGELAKADIGLLKYTFKSYGQILWDYANGKEESVVTTVGQPIKGIGNSCTIHFDVEDREIAHQVLLSLVETVGMRLRFAKMCCRVIAISIRKADDLLSYGHQMKIQSSTNCTNAIYEYCKRLFDEAWKGEPIRGLGVRVSDLSSADYVQLSMLERNWEKDKVVDKAVDRIRMRFGPMSVVRANFIQSGLMPLQGGVGEDSGFPVMTSIL